MKSWVHGVIEAVPSGTAEFASAVQPSPRDCPSCSFHTQDFILGYRQPSPRDSFAAIAPKPTRFERSAALRIYKEQSKQSGCLVNFDSYNVGSRAPPSSRAFSHKARHMIHFGLGTLRLSSAAVVCAALFMTQAAGAHPSAFSLSDVTQAPYPNGMVAAPAGSAVAWVFDTKGCRNIWVADPSHGAKARQITPYNRL